MKNTEANLFISQLKFCYTEEKKIFVKMKMTETGEIIIRHKDFLLRCMKSRELISSMTSNYRNVPNDITLKDVLLSRASKHSFISSYFLSFPIRAQTLAIQSRKAIQKEEFLWVTNTMCQVSNVGEDFRQLLLVLEKNVMH